MIEIEYISDIEKDESVKSNAKKQEQDSRLDTATTQTAASKTTEQNSQTKDQKEDTSKNDSDNSLVKPNINPKNLKPKDIFYGSIKFHSINGKILSKKGTDKKGIFMVLSSSVKGKRKQSKEFTLTDDTKNTYKVNSGAIKIENIKTRNKEFSKDEKNIKEKINKLIKEQEEKEHKQEEERSLKKMQFSFKSLESEDKLKKLIKAGMNNIWMVGPAGCGKSTIARNTAKELDIPYLCISCSIGTSATEFIGYKYPTREATKFAEFYAKKSLIIIDEITSLDPSVAQVINAALANNEIETTTGTVLRHPECIIVATSNTFGNGADRQYVANNQLDASTIDRFTGAIIRINYSKKYESQFDKEVRNYVYLLRKCIEVNSLRRIASTRMIQAGEKMKKIGISDWKELLITNWSDTEKKIVNAYIKTAEEKDELNLNTKTAA